jgi:hypothetical protein
MKFKGSEGEENKVFCLGRSFSDNVTDAANYIGLSLSTLFLPFGTEFIITIVIIISKEH